MDYPCAWHGGPGGLYLVNQEIPRSRGSIHVCAGRPGPAGRAGGDVHERMNQYLWKLRPYFRQVAGELVLGSLAGIVMNTAVVLPAILLGRAIDTALAVERGVTAPRAVGWAVLLYIGGVCLTEGPRMLKRWWLMTANARIRSNIRADAVRGVLAWPVADLHATPIGDLMARIIGDVEVLGVGVREFIIETWDTVLFSISLIVAMLVYDAELTGMVLVPVPLALLLARYSGRWVAARTAAARQANAELTATLQEQLAGLRVLRLFGRAGAAVDQIARRSQQQAQTNLATVWLKRGLQPVYTILITAGIMILIWQGGARVSAGLLTVGSFVAYLELYLRFTGRGFRIPQLINSIQSGGTAYARLQPLLASALSVAGEPPRASFRAGYIAGSTQMPEVPAVHQRGPIAVTLHDVTFCYPGAAAPALANLSLHIPAGSLVAVTGPVGSGKSALARVLLGVYPIASGRVLLDSRPVDSISADERTARIGYLPQESYLFSGTVRENILLHLAPDTDDRDALAKAVQCAALDADLATFPAGLDTEIGELGVRVSGGQRQRIALARTILVSRDRAPGLLVLDDPFSSVDVDTEAQLIANLRAAFGPDAPSEQRATIVLLSHRLAAFPQADQVVVLDRGQIVEQGRHAELAAADGVYARIFAAQRQMAQPVMPEESV